MRNSSLHYNKNNYYPFGLQHGSYNTPARDYRSIGDAREIEMVNRNPYKYKYNAKEYQDELGLDWYDYGARNYDASLGRYFSMDRMSEIYSDINPYQYTANNPVKFIDVNGDYIWINDGNDRYKYENGKLYSLNNESGKYDKEYIANDGSYVAQIQSSLNDIACHDCGFGQAFLNIFANDDIDVDIISNTSNEGGNKTTANGRKIYTDFNQNVNFVLSNGSQIKVSDNFYTTLGHELGHSLSEQLYNDKTLNSEWFSYNWINPRTQKEIILQQSKKEVFGTVVENAIRSENNLPLRTHYQRNLNGTVNEKSRVLMKSTLNPITGAQNYKLSPRAALIYNEIINSKKK
ncbi:RHS repeat-associated core domain-containing protein [Weeksellaceae bacterium KMM 9724]|uniref:RHS repeat-associated core domain-containing protein n=1 Tax=Profundicola chukchiensis TaxID=2961959 RepID=UPI00243FBFF0|nr:RHS repeat-associated core domain-containing protein [Profundicola chukchiensis]MDG4950145.1 RHS repeat-associated core domain-containing protein [Profundicola chukchiensis]